MRLRNGKWVRFVELRGERRGYFTISPIGPIDRVDRTDQIGRISHAIALHCGRHRGCKACIDRVAHCKEMGNGDRRADTLSSLRPFQFRIVRRGIVGIRRVAVGIAAAGLPQRLKPGDPSVSSRRPQGITIALVVAEECPQRTRFPAPDARPPLSA